MKKRARNSAKYKLSSFMSDRRHRERAYADGEMAKVREAREDSVRRERIDAKIKETAERLGVDPAGLMGGWLKPKIRTK